MTRIAQVQRNQPPVRYVPADLTELLDLNVSPSGEALKAPSAAPASPPLDQSVQEGSRNAVLTRMGGSARRVGASEAAIAAILQTANDTLCEPPLDAAEVERIAGSVARYAPGDPGAILNTLTDIGNANRIALNYGDRIRYVAEWKKWIVWDKSRWQIDSTGKLTELAKSTARRIHEEAAMLPDKDAQRAVSSHALKSQKAESLRAMVDLAKSIPELVVQSGQLDRDPMLLGVRNGIVDLRSGQLRPATPDDLMTMQCPVAYDPAATCPTFTGFLERVTNKKPALLSYLARIVGYSLTGKTTEQCLFFLYGSGANGKTTFLNTVKELMGPEYCKQTPTETLMVQKHGRSASNDLARLKGVRVTISTEVEDGSRMSEALIKQMTGSDTVAARFLYAEHFEFTPQFKIWLAGNHHPVVRGTDDGIWRRLQLVPFTVTIPVAEQDKNLPEQLRKELPGILAFAVRGCLEWQKEGIQVPQEVLDAVREYKTDMDILGQWVKEKCIAEKDARVQSTPAYENYKQWAIANGHHALSQNAFGRRLKGRFPKEESRAAAFYLGLRLRTPQELATDQASLAVHVAHSGPKPATTP